MNTIGIVGCGVVGTAVKEGMSHEFDVLTYDNNKECTCKSIHELVQRLDVDGPIFICVPTPMSSSGACDISIVDSVINEINEAAKFTDEIPVVAIKSTVSPGATEALSKKYTHVDIGFNPEFLTERNATEDFKNQDRIVVGASGRGLWAICTCLGNAFPDVPVYGCKPTEAEMVKYTANVHLAVKVSFANEISQVCQKLNISYDKVIELATKDTRLGESHWSVPGPDGLLGFGGTCFPKDLNALVHRACELGIKTPVMEGAWKKNLEVR
jgi:UDPglucose 6-dehydrogenase